MLTTITRYGITLFLLTALTACGGGGGGGDTSVTPPPPPPPTTFSIGGTANGIAGSGLTLQNNGADTLTVAADGSFTFATQVNSGDTYDVSVATQPGNPAQNCTVANGSGTATANVTNVTVSCATVSAADTDMDGISDADEQSIYGTNWEDPDTDGDGYTDGNEVQTYDPSVNNFRFNPLVADVPEIRLEIQETPQIGANITEANSSQQTVSTTRAQSTSNTSSTTFGASTTLGVEASQSATVGASVQGPSAEVETQVKVTAEATVSFDSTTSSENRSAWEEMQANNIETATTVSDGFVSVGVNIVNTGHLSLRIDALDIVAVRVNDGDEPFSAVGTLARDTAFSSIDLAAGESIDNLRFERTQIDLPTIRSLLTDTRSLKLEQGNVTIVDTSDSSVALQAQDINRRTAKLVIDYGPYAPTEFYRASTNVIPNQPGRSLATLMRDTLRVPFDEDGTGLTTVRNLSSSTGRWVITLKRSGDTATQVIPFDAQDASYSLDDIDVRAFDEVLLVLLEDPDNDGIGYREELLHGTDPQSADTDGDGRSDFEEIRESWFVNAINVQDPNRYNDTEVTSSPTIADYDNDGLSDSEEFADLLDPYNADTDGDGIGDANDTANGGAPLFSVLPLLLGEDPVANAASASPFDVQTSGAISAEAPRVVATASISWGDGAIDGPFETNPGGQSQRTIPLTTHTYPGPGDYQISLDANDDDTPVNTLNETAMVRLTAPEEPIDGAGYDAGYRLSVHFRTSADVNQDGYDDVIVMSNSNTRVSLGSPSGLQPYEEWSVGHWIPSIYQSLETDPRLLADIDNDGDLDLVGVDSSAGVVNYALNNGTGFGDPVAWLTGLDWNAGRDQAFLADVDGNGFIDFVHASTSDQSVTSYISNGSSLNLNAVQGETFDPRYPDRTRFPMSVKDMNKDGCADIVLFGQNDTFVNQSLCNGSFGQYISVVGGFGFDQGYRVGREERWVEDMTGDGQPDLVAAAGAVVVMYVNTSTTQSVSVDVGNRQTLSTEFVTDDGWAYNRDIDNRNAFGVFPRYLADINADGLMDIVGFGAAGASVSINQLGVDGAREFSDQRILSRAFDVTTNTDWYRNYTCGLSQPCREYGPRFVGDVNGDDRADLIGFTAGPSVYQEMPYVTQFE